MRSRNGIAICKVKAPMAESFEGAASASSFGTRSQSNTTMAKIRMPASHCGTRPARGPSHRKKRHNMTRSTLTNPSPSSSTFKTRRGFSRNSCMKFVSPGMILFEAAQLMRLQQKERCLHSGKQCGAEDQNGDGAQHNGQSRGTHFLRHQTPRTLCGLSSARDRGGRTRSLRRVGGSWFAHPLSRKQVKAPDEQTREDFTVVGRSDWEKMWTRTTQTWKDTRITARFSVAGTNSGITRRTMFWNSFGSTPNRPTQIISKG